MEGASAETGAPLRCMSGLGQTRRFVGRPAIPRTDFIRPAGLARFVPTTDSLNFFGKCLKQNDLVPRDNTPGMPILAMLDVNEISATIARLSRARRAGRSDRHAVDADSN